MEELIIVGGGVAGLGCLNALLDHNVSPLLLEGSAIGSPKMCGEFLAPPVIEPLKQWGIGPLQTIKQARFIGTNTAMQCSFPRPAGAYARHQAELELAVRARKLGGRILEQSPIKHITPPTKQSPYVLQLASGETLQARAVIFATGRFSQSQGLSKYVGFKTHVSKIIEPETLLMFGFSGGYLGIVPVTSETSNLTCLVKREVVEAVGSCHDFLEATLTRFSSLRATQSNPVIQGSALDCFASLEKTDWLEGPAPAFGMKTRPNWSSAYWIGDAFASVHPAIGYGFAHSVTSALLAAKYYLKQDPSGYQMMLQQTMRPKRMIGFGMHHLLQKPRLCSAVSHWVEANQWISHGILNFLDY